MSLGLIGCGTPDIMRGRFGGGLIFNSPDPTPAPRKTPRKPSGKTTTKKEAPAEKVSAKPARPGRPRGLVGCGTPEIMFREQAKNYLKGFEGVVGISFKDNTIVVRVVTQENGEALPKTFYRRKITFVVTGVISKRRTVKR